MNSTENVSPKRISRKDAHSSSDSLLANNSANLDIALNETANQHQEDMKQHSTDEENNIGMTKETSYIRRLLVTSVVTSPKNVLLVSHGEI